jgi:hypothetical protein
MSSDPARLPGSMPALRLTQFGTPTPALVTALVPLPTAAEGESLVPSSGADSFTPPSGLKARVDPGDVIRSSHPIQPAR